MGLLVNVIELNNDAATVHILNTTLLKTLPNLVDKYPPTDRYESSPMKLFIEFYTLFVDCVAKILQQGDENAFTLRPVDDSITPGDDSGKTVINSYTLAIQKLGVVEWLQAIANNKIKMQDVDGFVEESKPVQQRAADLLSRYFP